jgi:hypothetical protein
MTWNKVNIRQFSGAGDELIHSLTIWKGALWVGTQDKKHGCDVYRSRDGGRTWKKMTVNGFGLGPPEQEAYHLIVWQDQLVVGTFDPTLGGHVWATSDGVHWRQLVPTGLGFGSLYVGVPSLTVFHGILIGTMHTRATADVPDLLFHILVEPTNLPGKVSVVSRGASPGGSDADGLKPHPLSIPGAVQESDDPLFVLPNLTVLGLRVDNIGDSLPDASPDQVQDIEYCEGALPVVGRGCLLDTFGGGEGILPLADNAEAIETSYSLGNGSRGYVSTVSMKNSTDPSQLTTLGASDLDPLKDWDLAASFVPRDEVWYQPERFSPGEMIWSGDCLMVLAAALLTERSGEDQTPNTPLRAVRPFYR